MTDASTEHIVVIQKDAWIYFLAVDDRFIKIGRSSQPRGVRLKQHSAPALDGHISENTLLCELKGCAADEKALHRFFAKSRDGVGVEMFRGTPDLVGYVRWLRDRDFVAIPEDSDEVRDSLPMPDAEHWMPRYGERTTPRDTSMLPGIMQGPFDIGPRVLTIDDFYTNQVIVEAARTAMGSIDLDPASHARANVVVQATTFYTKASNGLAQRWHGNVWLNPPFSAWAPWVAKIMLELTSGRVTQLCVLAATRTLTAQYFSPLLKNCLRMCVTTGRIPFWGVRAASPDDGHVIIYFGTRPDEFERSFASIGNVFSRPAATDHGFEDQS